MFNLDVHHRNVMYLNNWQFFDDVKPQPIIGYNIYAYKHISIHNGKMRNAVASIIMFIKADIQSWLLILKIFYYYLFLNLEIQTHFMPDVEILVLLHLIKHIFFCTDI